MSNTSQVTSVLPIQSGLPPGIAAAGSGSISKRTRVPGIVSTNGLPAGSAPPATGFVEAGAAFGGALAADAAGAADFGRAGAAAGRGLDLCGAEPGTGAACATMAKRNAPTARTAPETVRRGVVGRPAGEKCVGRITGRRCLLFVFFLAMSASAPAETSGLARHQYTQLHMGVQVRIVAYAPDTASAERAARAAFARIAILEDFLSDYRPTSELMRLCARAGGRRLPSAPNCSSCSRARRRWRGAATGRSTSRSGRSWPCGAAPAVRRAAHAPRAARRTAPWSAGRRCGSTRARERSSC
jgi:hypothetical protein